MARSALTRISSVVATTATFAAAILAPAPALACWDGMAAHGERVDVSVWRDGSWRPATARHMAVWITRLDALVPAGTKVSIFGPSITCDGPACPVDLASTPEVEPGDMASAFDVTAKMLGVTPTARSRAANLSASVYTVQVHAGAKKGAMTVRDRMHDLHADFDVAGFYVEGGFPGVQKTAHIVEDAGTYRVVVGAHRSIADAKQVADLLTARGVTAFVRTMPRGRSVDEYASSASRE